MIGHATTPLLSPYTGRPPSWSCCEFALAKTWGFANRPVRHQMIVAHMPLGILLSAVVLARIAWRLMPGHQVSSAVSGWVEIASKAVHYLLYTLLVVQAVLVSYCGGPATRR
jgi:cytochrome b561